MTDDKDICGEITDEGEICRLPSGWGLDNPDGPCKHHADTTTLPRKWTDDRVQTIYDELQTVPSFKHACQTAGISARTGHTWKQRGKELEEELSESEIEHDDAARRLVQFFHTVNAHTGSGRSGLLASAIEYAHKKKNPDALLRIYQQLEGGDTANDDLGEDDALTDLNIHLEAPDPSDLPYNK